MSKKVLTLLLVEDNTDHAMLIREVLEENNVHKEIHVVEDGVEALDYLYQRGKFENKETSPRPDLILLDIKLPKLDGLEVLRCIKADPSLKSIPVVIISSSKQIEEIRTAYANGVNSYVCKPVKFGDFADKLKNLKSYWLLVNALPNAGLSG